MYIYRGWIGTKCKRIPRTSEVSLTLKNKLLNRTKRTGEYMFKTNGILCIYFLLLIILAWCETGKCTVHLPKNKSFWVLYSLFSIKTASGCLNERTDGGVMKHRIRACPIQNRSRAEVRSDVSLIRFIIKGHISIFSKQIVST